MMLRRKNDDALRDLARLLSRGQFLTAARVADVMGCAKAIAYGRIRALKSNGLTLQTCRVREAPSGPEATAYALILDKKSKQFLV